MIIMLPVEGALAAVAEPGTVEPWEIKGGQRLYERNHRTI